jgi:hypothetical protein
MILEGHFSVNFRFNNIHSFCKLLVCNVVVLNLALRSKLLDLGYCKQTLFNSTICQLLLTGLGYILHLKLQS